MEEQEYKRRKALMSTTSNQSRSAENSQGQGKTFQSMHLSIRKLLHPYLTKYLIQRIVSNTFLGWQIIRTSESTSEEFVMIYDLWIEQAEEDEEGEEDTKKQSDTNYDNEQKKESQGAIEE